MSPGRSAKRPARGNRKRAAPVKPMPAAVRPPDPPQTVGPVPRPEFQFVKWINSPAAKAYLQIVGALASVAALIRTSFALAVVGVILFAIGVYRFGFKAQRVAVRVGTIVGVVLVVGVVLLLIIQQAVKPGTTEFSYDGSPVGFTDRSPLAGTQYPTLTDDPDAGSEVAVLTEPVNLAVSCWVNGHYQGKDLAWVSIVEGEYRSLWVPLSDVGVMGPGAARTILPCSNWRWRFQNIP
jgi:hypothetical protein